MLVPVAAVRTETYNQPEPVEAVEPVKAEIKTVISHENDSITSFESPFVLIHPGNFLMGSPDYETGRSGDEILHEVTLTKEFFIQTTPVTQGQWKAVMGNNPASFSEGGDNCPIESVSWNECQEFIKRLNSKQNCIYRLPTEAEWEYACRAGSSTSVANGDIVELYCAIDPVLSGDRVVLRQFRPKMPAGWL